MRALVTGSNGTVGTVLCHHLARAGWSLVRWDRTEVPIGHYASMEAFVARSEVDAIFHLAAASQPTQPHAVEAEAWRVNFEWTSELAWIARQHEIDFVFTSTVMVFTEGRSGPYSVAARPDAAHGYGYQKRLAEERVFEQNPSAKVVRLGWQIGDNLRGNQMAAWLAEHKVVEASTRWLPACSLLQDTADALIRVATGPAGLFHVDSNEGWSFFDLATALNERHGGSWTIRPTWDRAYDGRLIDPRLALPTMAAGLPQLRKA